MAEKQKLVIVLTRGMDDERSSVAWSIANASLACDFEVTMFLTSSGLDWVRKGAADRAHLNPFDPPMKDLIHGFLEQGGVVMACPPCAQVRGYSEESFIDGVVVAGAPAMLEKIKAGASTLCF